jgi:hypothetical protein
VDGIHDVADCGRGLLVVRVCELFLYRRESGWVGLCRGVGRGYMGVALKGGGVQEEGVGFILHNIYEAQSHEHQISLFCMMNLKRHWTISFVPIF